MRRVVSVFASLAAVLFCVTGCGIYSFSGTSIHPDVKTICIEPVVNKALKINPSLANSMNEAICDKFRKLTSLEQIDDVGDLNLSIVIDSYEVRASAITADEVAAQNRLTVQVKVKFVNNVVPEENFERSFAGFEDYDSQRSIDEVEAGLCDSIIEKIVEDIFNATVANW